MMTLAILGLAREMAAPKISPWHPCTSTTYGLRLNGNPYDGGGTASGEVYDDHGWTVAVPFKKGTRKPSIPFGTRIDLIWHGRTVKGVKVNDVCPAGTYDVTAFIMEKLLGKYEDTKLRGSRWRRSNM